VGLAPFVLPECEALAALASWLCSVAQQRPPFVRPECEALAAQQRWPDGYVPAETGKNQRWPDGYVPGKTDKCRWSPVLLFPLKGCSPSMNLYCIPNMLRVKYPKNYNVE